MEKSSELSARDRSKVMGKVIHCRVGTRGPHARGCHRCSSSEQQEIPFDLALGLGIDLSLGLLGAGPVRGSAEKRATVNRRGEAVSGLQCL